MMELLYVYLAGCGTIILTYFALGMTPEGRDRPIDLVGLLSAVLLAAIWPFALVRIVYKVFIK